ncbi:MAG: cell division protein FtsB [Gammaproteobacteria bacterium]
MKLLIAILITMLCALQYKLWVQPNGVGTLVQLHRHILHQTKENQRLTQRNQALAAEVTDLKHGHVALEERARNELGMLKEDESFYQVVHEK